jgi:hypothetical protein
MPAKVSLPETKEFRLELLDERQGVPEDEKTTVTIRLATVRQNTVRGRLFSRFITELPSENEIDSRERRIYDLPFYDLIAEEIYLTLVGCNITTHDGKTPLFIFKNSSSGPFLDMSKKQFIDAIGTLDDDTLAEIHSKVLEMNPHWIMGGTTTKEEASLGEES